eukprot:TRINITY_DN53801_c0_g1_i1.p1 TRINITY_DN53801_c0_g1~~TRINITY_DN53801_c0_g1_i1.p1  ORF type:complete len:227 (-),score=36.92 TRINITY_DN53801_c0_g1_i1:110-790(-)
MDASEQEIGPQQTCSTQANPDFAPRLTSNESNLTTSEDMPRTIQQPGMTSPPLPYAMPQVMHLISWENMRHQDEMPTEQRFTFSGSEDYPLQANRMSTTESNLMVCAGVPRTIEQASVDNPSDASEMLDSRFPLLLRECSPSVPPEYEAHDHHTVQSWISEHTYKGGASKQCVRADRNEENLLVDLPGIGHSGSFFSEVSHVSSGNSNRAVKSEAMPGVRLAHIQE